MSTCFVHFSALPASIVYFTDFPLSNKKLKAGDYATRCYLMAAVERHGRLVEGRADDGRFLSHIVLPFNVSLDPHNAHAVGRSCVNQSVNIRRKQ